MKTQQWLEAHRAGAIRHEWAELDLTDGVNHLRLRVSADGPKVRGIREGAGSEATQQLADAMGALMTTSRLRQMRHVASSVIIEPIPLPYTSPAARHSELLDVRIQSAIPWEGWGHTAAQAKSLAQLTEVDECVETYGPRTLTWMVSNNGKGFIRDARNTATHGTNDGWIVHESQVMWKGGKAWWTRSPYRLEHEGPMGIRVYPCESLPGFYKIQPTANAHGHHQGDYPSGPELVHGRCQLNGSDAPTAMVYTTARYAGLVFHDGQPVKDARHPGVALHVPEAGSSPPPSSEPETEPRAVPVWLTPSLTPAERQLAWMLAHEGLAEQPLGSNTGADIEVFDAICVRDGQPNFGAWLSNVPNDWCASCCSYSAHITRLPTDPPMPFKARASVKELKDDAVAADCFVPMADIVSGAVVPQPGWKVLWPRFDPGTTRVTWRGHVDTLVRVIGWDGHKLMAEVVGGNVGHKITRRTLDLLKEPLPVIGMIRIPGGDESTTMPGPERSLPAVDRDDWFAEGLDVSRYQSPNRCDYDVLARRFGWMIVKLSQGVGRDRHGAEHTRRARAARMRVGGYHFFDPGIPWSAQFDTFKAAADAAGYGKPGDIVPVLDIEKRAGVPFDAAAHVEPCRKLAREMAIRLGGAMIYINLNTIALMGYPEWIREHSLWIASETENPEPTRPPGWDWDIWQYAALRVDGCAVDIDVNRALRVPLIPENA